MDPNIEKQLFKIVAQSSQTNDVSHDINHTIRVVENAKKIAEKEGGDLDIIVPAAIFHDAIVYLKNSKESKQSTFESANLAQQELQKHLEYPQHKIKFVKKLIEECSFSKGIKPKSIESQILQDADRLEATGAFSIMRTFASAGVMNNSFISPQDPFCTKRKPEPKKYALDLFYSRLLIVKDAMNTEYAKELADQRTEILEMFLQAVKNEL